MNDYYYTIINETKEEIKIKGSRFIGETKIVNSTDEALESLKVIKKREYNASHHCYAYTLGVPEINEFKYSDDGEPNGTAGKPIYDVVMGSGVTNLLLVVTRYFGGTKLGTGGLVRAYSDAAKAVIEKSGIEEKYLKDKFNIEIAFKYYDSLLILLRKHKVEIVDSSFGEVVNLKLAVRLSFIKPLENEFIELTSGRGKLEKEQ